MFTMLILHQLFNLSAGVAFRLRLKSLNFKSMTGVPLRSFFGLGAMNNIPDATTLAFFRERLRKAEVIEGLFEMCENYLRSQVLEARGGQISM